MVVDLGRGLEIFLVVQHPEHVPDVIDCSSLVATIAMQERVNQRHSVIRVMDVRRVNENNLVMADRLAELQD